MDIAYLIETEKKCERCNDGYKVPNKPYCLNCKKFFEYTCKFCEKSFFSVDKVCKHVFINENFLSTTKYGTGVPTNHKLVKRWMSTFYIQKKFPDLEFLIEKYKNSNFVNQKENREDYFITGWMKTLDEKTVDDYNFAMKLAKDLRIQHANKSSWMYFQSYEMAKMFKKKKIEIKNPKHVGYYISNLSRQHFPVHEYLYCLPYYKEVSSKRVPKSDIIPAYHYEDLLTLNQHDYLKINNDIKLEYDNENYFDSTLKFINTNPNTQYLSQGDILEGTYSDLLSRIIIYNK